MLTDLTNVQINAFQKDYDKNAEIILLEGAKQDEILKIAKARGIELKGSRDLAGFKAVYTIADITDSNDQIVPKKKLLKVLPTLIGKPINLLHQRKYVTGHYIDYRFSEKDNKVISYGVFYKSNFAEEWETVKAFFKTKQLGMSSEIWSPKSSWKYNKDGSFVLGEMELAGGALVYPPDEPAISGADVLAIAKKAMDANSDVDLLYSTKYSDEEILTAGEIAVEEKTETTVTKEVTEEPKVEDTIVSKVICGNCGEEFAPVPGNNKCKKCFAIIDEAGKVMYPPQIINFSINCLNPSCGTRNWLILKQTEKTAQIRCMSCSKEYDVTFADDKLSAPAQLMDFIYSTVANCPQCHTSIQVSGVSSVSKRKITCKKCKLQFDIDVGKSVKQTINSIKEIIVDNKPIDSSKGGKEVKKEEKIEEKPVESTEEKVESKVEEEKVETKTEETKVTEEKVEEAPVEEKTEEPKPEVKTEETEKVEEKVEEEKPAEEKVEEEKPEVKEEKSQTAEEVVETPAEEKTDEKPAEEKVEPEVSEEKVEEEPKEAKGVKWVKLYRDRIKKLLQVLRDTRKSSKEELDTVLAKVEFYKANAKILVDRKAELGTAAEKLTDEQIMDDEKFELAKSIKADQGVEAEVERANEDDITSAMVKGMNVNVSELDEAAKEITKKAFAHVNEKK